MVTLRVFLQSPLDTLARVSNEAEPVDADTVYKALIDICASNPLLRDRLFNGEHLSPYIHIFLNGELIPTDESKDQPVFDNDELCLLTAIRGG